ncbi:MULTISPECIES: hypothetical protein, partial [Cysteiniphilum]
LGVTGTTSTNGITNTGNISTTADMSSATSTVSGDSTVGGTLGVTGTTSTNGITNTGNISTTADMSSATSTVSGDSTVGGTLGVNGAVTLNGATVINNSLDVTSTSLNIDSSNKILKMSNGTADVIQLDSSGEGYLKVGQNSLIFDGATNTISATSSTTSDNVVINGENGTITSTGDIRTTASGADVYNSYGESIHRNAQALQQLGIDPTSRYTSATGTVTLNAGSGTISAGNATTGHQTVQVDGTSGNVTINNPTTGAQMIELNGSTGNITAQGDVYNGAGQSIGSNAAAIATLQDSVSGLKASAAINTALTSLNYVAGMNSIAISYGTMQGKNALAIGMQVKFGESNTYMNFQGGSDFEANQLGGSVGFAVGF